MSPADHIVQEMAQMGALFTIAADRGGSARWQWSPQPETMRLPIRKLWRSAKVRPSDEEMIAAIRRVGFTGGAA